MRSANAPWRISLTAFVALFLATPKLAHAYVDPGTGSMLWQIMAAAAIGSLFYVRRVFTWMRNHCVFQSCRATGYLFATLFALIASPLMVMLFSRHPLPRFNDIFLIGIILTAYLFTWDSALYLLAIGVGVTAWLLPPAGSFAISGADAWFRLLSFAAVSMLAITIITRLKSRRPQVEPSSRPELLSHSATAGAD